MSKFLTLALGVLLLAQPLTEVFLLFFTVGSEAYEFAYYIPMRLFHIGLLPSLFLLYICKTRIDKTIGLTLVYSQLFWVVREILAMNSGNDWLVLTVSSVDYCWFVFIALPLILSLVTDAILNSHICRNSRICLLLSGYFKGSKNNGSNSL